MYTILFPRRNFKTYFPYHILSIPIYINCFSWIGSGRGGERREEGRTGNEQKSNAK